MADPDPLADLPPPDDPGQRFLAPASRPVAAGTRAAHVLAAAGVAPRLDRRMAIQFLAHDEYDARRTFFEGLRLVAPREILRREADGTVSVAVPNAPPPLALDVEAAAERLREVLEAAVHDAVVGAEVVAVALSGGLDSSAVAVLASDVWRRLGRDPAKLRFHHMLPRSGPDEADHARAVAAHLGHTLVLDEDDGGDPFAGEEALVAALDFPPDGGGSAAWRRALVRMREGGADVVLSGDGGDEVAGPVGGRRPPRDRLASGVRIARRVAGIAIGPLRRPIRRRAFLSALPRWIAERVRDLPPPDTAPVERSGLRGDGAVRDRAIRCARQTMLVEHWRAIASIGGPSPRFPFLDPRVTDLVVSLPPCVVAADDRDKGLLRRALAGRLPEVQRARPKDQPLLEPLQAAALRAYGRASLERWLRGSALETSGLVPFEEAAAQVEAAGRGDVREVPRALALVGLVAWAGVHRLGG